MIDHYLSHNELNKARNLLAKMDVPNAVTFSCFSKYYLHSGEFAKSLEAIKKTLE
jgi:hypothetical protein